MIKRSMVVLGLALASSPAWAIFTNGGFESGSFAGWTVTTGTNPGLSGAPPFTGANVVISAGGSNVSAVIGAQTDPRAPQLKLPYVGNFTGRVNDSGTGAIINSIKQQDVITNADRDPGDGQLHVRFSYAPVLEDPGHSPNDQPYFYVRLRNITKNTLLYEEFAYSGQPGKTFVTTGAWKSYPNFVAVDIVVPSGNLGDTLEIEALAADCSLGGHGGYVYLDGFGSAVVAPGQVLTPVPTLSEWALILLSLGLGVVALRSLRNNPPHRLG